MHYLLIALQIASPIVVILAVIRGHFLLRRFIMTTEAQIAEVVAESEAVAEATAALSAKTDLVLQKLTDVSTALATLQASTGSSPELDAVIAKLKDVEATVAGTSAKEDAALVPTPPSAA
jgi:hypothetical protein